MVITYSSDRSKEHVNDLIYRINSEAGSSAVGVQCDLQSLQAPKQIVDAARHYFGTHIDILINNAAMITDKWVQDITPQHFDDAFHLNVRAPLLMVQAILPHLRAPGRIINISSVASRDKYPGVGTYAASKAALEGYTRTWATELGKDGTTVNVVNPGPVESEMLDQVDRALVERQKAATPVQNRVGNPEEIADVVAFLAGLDSRWISGQCISVSGGFMML